MSDVPCEVTILDPATGSVKVVFPEPINIGSDDIYHLTYALTLGVTGEAEKVEVFRSEITRRDDDV